MLSSSTNIINVTITKTLYSYIAKQTIDSTFSLKILFEKINRRAIWKQKKKRFIFCFHKLLVWDPPSSSWALAVNTPVYCTGYAPMMGHWDAFVNCATFEHSIDGRYFLSKKKEKKKMMMKERRRRESRVPRRYRRTLFCWNFSHIARAVGSRGPRFLYHAICKWDICSRRAT